ncbi:MAG: helix-turn-helix domain-containing protein [Candidatus Heimdallarchaeota archaeon]|nr:helix-turn-helix domain-containing protein [Candidatus Heimdallarchaeota archaeon]
MYEIKIKIKHDCPYLKISSIFDFPVYLYCSELYDLMIIPKQISQIEMDKISSYVVDKDSLEFNIGRENISTTYVYFRCMCNSETSVSPNIQKYGGMVEHPVVYEDGWEHYKVICLNNKTQVSILKYIQTVEQHKIVSIKDLGREGIFKTQFVSTHELIDKLTDRQIDVIVKAYEEGYYEIPRSIKTEEIAQQFNVSRAATEKSLRKAENSIMKIIMPYLFFHRRINLSGNNHSKVKLSG